MHSKTVLGTDFRIYNQGSSLKLLTSDIRFPTSMHWYDWGNSLLHIPDIRFPTSVFKVDNHNA
jgi:hypothetical protein